MLWVEYILLCRISKILMLVLDVTCMYKLDNAIIFHK